VENLSHAARPGRLLLAGMVLCATQGAMASEKRTIAVGATVVAASQCRIDATSGSRCSGTAAAPQVSAASASPASQASFQGRLVMNVSAVAASLDSRNTLAAAPERVVLTIAP
jgi:hypothetical protein